MIKSKSINVFLIDGDPTGRIKCTMQNWTGIAYKIPRIKLEDCKDGKTPIVSHLKQTGIYFLLGEDENEKPLVYVGQAGVRKNGEGLLLRLLEHKKNEKETYYNDWNEVICFTTQNDAFGPTEISYLENRFTNLAIKASRYAVRNGNEPNPGNITEEKESEMEEFIDYARIIVGVLGHKVFEPFIKVIDDTAPLLVEKESPIFFFNGKYKATGKMTNEGFVLLKGSQVSPNFTASAFDSIKRDRNKYSDKISDFVTTEDILFSSQSRAACFVAAASASGNRCWKTIDGKSPKDI